MDASIRFGNVLLPQHVAAEHNVHIGDPNHGIAAGVAGIISNVDSPRAQVKIDVAIVDHRRQRERLHARLLLRRNRRIQHLDVLGAHPCAHVAMRHDRRSGSRKHVITIDVVQMIMGVDDEADRQRRKLANLAEQRLGGPRVLERIDHQNAVVADHESRRCRRPALRHSRSPPKLRCRSFAIGSPGRAARWNVQRPIETRSTAASSANHPDRLSRGLRESCKVG